MRPEEAEWGTYLVTFEQDHFEMGGLNPEYFPLSIYNLVADNIRVCEVKNDPEDAISFGIDKIMI